MTNLIKAEVCFQCGKKTTIISKHKELIGQSVVETTESKCMDPDCQQRIDDQQEKELTRIRESLAAKEANEKEKAERKRMDIKL